MRGTILKRAGICSSVFVFSMFLVSCNSAVEAKQTEEISGNACSVETLSLVMEDLQVLKEVSPPNPEGYYNYYEPQDGYEYVVLSGKAENIGSEKIHADNFMIIVQEEIDAKLVFLNSSESEFQETLDSGETSKFYLLALCEKPTKNLDSFSFFYNDGLKKGEQKIFDKQLIWRFDKEKK